VKISLTGKISEFKLNALDRGEFKIKDAPTPNQHFADRAGQWPVPSPEKYHEKAITPLRSMTIVDMKFHAGELYVAGISNEEFSSTLRRVPYPFTDAISETRILLNRSGAVQLAIACWEEGAFPLHFHSVKGGRKRILGER
jgi:hypothetical protein